MSDRHITDADWQQIETLLGKLGIDANTVLIDWQSEFIDSPPLRLRDQLEEINDGYLNFPKFLTPLQVAETSRKTLGKIEDVLAEFERQATFWGVLGGLYKDQPAAAAKTALIAFADKLHKLIADCEAAGSSSRDNAAKETRNAC